MLIVARLVATCISHPFGVAVPRVPPDRRWRDRRELDDVLDIIGSTA